MEEKCVYVVMADAWEYRDIVGIYEDYETAYDWVMEHWKEYNKCILIRKITLGHEISLNWEDDYDDWVFDATISTDKKLLILHDRVNYVTGDKK